MALAIMLVVVVGVLSLAVNAQGPFQGGAPLGQARPARASHPGAQPSPPGQGPSPTDPGQGGAQPGAPTGSPSGSPRQRPPTTGGARRPPGGF